MPIERERERESAHKFDPMKYKFSFESFLCVWIQELYRI